MIEVRGCFKIVRTNSVGATTSGLSGHLDHVMDAVVGLRGILDAAIEADLPAGVVRITVTVDSVDLDEGSAVGVAAIRTAIHAAGGQTGDWGQSLVETSRQSELVGG